MIYYGPVGKRRPDNGPRRPAFEVPSRKAFEGLVAEALDGLPEEFRKRLDNIAVVVEEEPTPEELSALGMEPEEELFGAYWGQALPDRTPTDYWGGLPDRIVIYRSPILRACRNRAEIIQEVRDTVLHEVGHYFGLDEDELPF